MNKQKQFAFTLAEVLITLGIIGVVAAMTMPSVINKYRIKILENKFKQTQSIISQILEQIKYDTGVNSIYDYYSKNTSNELKNEFYKHIKSSQKVIKHPKYLTYDGSQEFSASDNAYSITDYISHDIVLTNNATINIAIRLTMIGKTIQIPVDINGSKGPNRAGYDLFVFLINSSNDKLTGMIMTKLYSENELEKFKNKQGIQGYPCSKSSKQVSNGVGCTGFAIQNVCPDDLTKTYWECLYK